MCIVKPQILFDIVVLTSRGRKVTVPFLESRDFLVQGALPHDVLKPLMCFCDIHPTIMQEVRFSRNLK